MDEPHADQAGTIEVGPGLRVHRLGFGAMRLPGIWGDPELIDDAHRLLRRAVDLGVRFIDTAHAYGVSEERIGEALFPYPSDLIIATKAGLGRGPDGRPGTLRAQVDRSLERLRLERIDLLQLHTVDPSVPIEESVGALVELQDHGKVRSIGVSNVSVEQLARARSVAKIVSVQNRYSIAHRASDDVLAVCEREEIAFLPYFPLGAGRLAGASELNRLAEERGATPAQLALAWLLHRSPVMLPIPGTSSLDHLEENIAAAGISLSEEEFGRLSSRSVVSEDRERARDGRRSA